MNISYITFFVAKMINLFTRMLFTRRSAVFRCVISHRLVATRSMLAIVESVSEFEKRNILKVVNDHLLFIPDHFMSIDDWHKFDAAVNTTPEFVNQGNLWRTSLIQNLNPTTQALLLHSLVQYILRIHEPDNVAILSMCLMSLAKLGKFDEYNATLKQLESHLTTYNKPLCLGRIAKSLCLTPRWREAKQYVHEPKNDIEMNLFGKRADITPYLLHAACKSKCYDEMLALMQEIKVEDATTVTKALTPCFILFFQNMQVFSDASQLNVHREYLSTFLDILQEKEIVLTEDAAESFEMCFQTLFDYWTIKNNLLIRKDTCPGCQKSLPKMKMSPKEFAQMREDFRQICINNNYSLFESTKDFENLLSFLSPHAKQPFQCVLDFLNFAGVLISSKSFDSHTLMQRLYSTFEILKLQHNVRKILVISRKNQVVLSQELNTYLMQLARELNIQISAFYTNSHADDDTFLLYAGMWNGPECYILTHDNFRQYKYHLGEKWSHLFSRWQQSRHIMSKCVIPVSLLPPQHYESRVHGSISQGVLHVPYSTDTAGKGREKCLWLCCKAN